MRNYLRSLLAFATLLMIGYQPSYAEEYGYVFEPPYSAVFKPDFMYEDMYYRFVDGGVELTRAQGSSKTVPHYEEFYIEVPSTVKYNGQRYNVVGIGADTFMGNKFAWHIILPEGLRYIDKGAFSCSEIREFILPSTVKTVGDYAFAYCDKINWGLTIPDSVESIGKYAFAGCGRIGVVWLGNGLKSLSRGCFGYLTHSFRNLNGVTEWYYYKSHIAEIHCSSPTPPACDYLNGIPGGNDNSEGEPSYDLFKSCEVYVPVGSKKAYSEAPGWKLFAKILDGTESELTENMVENEGIHLEGGRIIGDGIMDVYDLGGRQIARGTTDQLPTLPAGFYVVRNSTSNAKILIP